MIVICAKCATQFQLDEARVPEAGIRVRCSLCKHAFFVEHPDALGEPSSDPVTRAVEEVLEAEAPGLPEAIHDLEAPQSPGTPAAGLRTEARDDEDWEWSDGGPLLGAPAEAPEGRFEQSFEAARAAVDDLLGGDEPPFATAPSPAARVVTPELQGLPHPDAELGPLGADPPALADDPWEVPAWSEGEAGASQGPDPAPPQALADAGGGARGAPLETDAGEFETDAGELETDADQLETDAGEFETDAGELDPFDDDLAAPPGAGDLAAPDRLDLDGLDDAEPPGSARLEALSGRELEEGPYEARPHAESTLPSRPRESLPVAVGALLEPGGSLRVPAALARAGDALGWCAVAILAVPTLWAAVTPRTGQGARAGAQVLAGLEASGIEGRWVENAFVGPLYVVRGELRNAGAEPRAPGSRLVVRLLDAEGAPLDAPAVSLAPPAPPQQLREAHPRELRGAREAGAQELARTPLAAGASVRFEAIVENLPDAARRFDLAVAPAGASRPPEAPRPAPDAGSG